jgi:hypothetical protein
MTLIIPSAPPRLSGIPVFNNTHVGSNSSANSHCNSSIDICSFNDSVHTSQSSTGIMPVATTTTTTTAPPATTTRISGTIRSKNPLKGAVEIIPVCNGCVSTLCYLACVSLSHHWLFVMVHTLECFLLLLFCGSYTDLIIVITIALLSIHSVYSKSQDRLYYASLKSPPPSHNILASLPRKQKSDVPLEKKQIHFFTIDHELVYWNFFLDFGPLNLGQFTRFRHKLNDKLRRFPVVCVYSNTVPAKRANAIFLICAWQVLQLQRSPEQAYRGFDVELSQSMATMEDSSSPPVSTSQGAVTIQSLPSFHDASPCPCTFDLTVLDCIQGLAKARRLGLFNDEHFDVEEYEHFEQVEVSTLCCIRVCLEV